MGKEDVALPSQERITKARMAKYAAITAPWGRGHEGRAHDKEGQRGAAFIKIALVQKLCN